MVRILLPMPTKSVYMSFGCLPTWRSKELFNVGEKNMYRGKATFPVLEAADRLGGAGTAQEPFGLLSLSHQRNPCSRSRAAANLAELKR